MVRLDALEHPPGGLFWSAPLALDSDFTAEDPLALDYLGQQVGLWLFPRFTTRTARAQNYAVVLYGLHLADRAIREHGYAGDDTTRTRLFERWERFWALATLESRDGQLAPGDDDAMRGVRGARRVWTPGEHPLSLDFQLISRQNELGGLGAYLTSLRECGLVFPGSLRVTPAAQTILDAFWTEPSERESSHLYDEYALLALDRDQTTVPRKHGKITLAGIGRRSRLSMLVKRQRTAQQARLWEALFLSSRDPSTLPLASQIIAAHGDGVDGSEALLDGMLVGRWGALAAEVSNRIDLALAFGRVARVLLSRFDRAYGHVDTHGWRVDAAAVAEAAFPLAEMTELRAGCTVLLAKPDTSRFRKLQFHGPDFINLLTKLVDAGPRECLDHVLQFHRNVQRARNGGGAWLCDEAGKLVIQIAAYNGYKRDTEFPGFKLDVVRRLLRDLGRLT